MVISDLGNRVGKTDNKGPFRFERVTPWVNPLALICRHAASNNMAVSFIAKKIVLLLVRWLLAFRLEVIINSVLVKVRRFSFDKFRTTSGLQKAFSILLFSFGWWNSSLTDCINRSSQTTCPAFLQRWRDFLFSWPRNFSFDFHFIAMRCRRGLFYHSDLLSINCEFYAI